MTVTVYTSPACPACMMTKLHLKRRGIEFSEVSLDSEEGIRAAAIETGAMTSPVVCVRTDDGRELQWDGYHPDKIDELT